MIDHWFWWLLTATCLLWYFSVTVYVAFKGAGDIKSMLKRLEANHRNSQSGNTGNG